MSGSARVRARAHAIPRVYGQLHMEAIPSSMLGPPAGGENIVIMRMKCAARGCSCHGYKFKDKSQTADSAARTNCVGDIRPELCVCDSPALDVPQAQG